jgi:hypothetical protein
LQPAPAGFFISREIQPLPVAMNKDILPDCRAKEAKDRIFTPIGAWVPVFCANCGVDGGSCPEENMTFIFYLCKKCAETYGKIAGTMLMPDEVFFEKLKQEQLASHGKFLTQEELAAVVEADASPLATLLKTGR